MSDTPDQPASPPKWPLGPLPGIRLLSAILVLFVMVLVDHFSVGCFLFKLPTAAHPSTVFFSSCVFLLTNFASQLVYSLSSSMETGVAAGIIYESIGISRRMAEQVYAAVFPDGVFDQSRMSSFYLNLFICMAVGTAIFALVSFVPCFLGLGEYLKNLPLLAVFSVMAAIGIGLLQEAFTDMPGGGQLGDSSFYVAIGTILGCGLTMFFIEMFFPAFSFLVPSAAFVVILSFNLYYRVFTGGPQTVQQLQADRLLIDFATNGRSIFSLFELFGGCSFSVRALLLNIGNILTLVLMNLIHINVNLLPYAIATGQPVDFNVEWRAQGLSNLVTACTGFPSYFVCSTSILFFKTGGTTRMASVLGSFVPLILLLLVPYVSTLIPTVLSKIICCYLGLSFFSSYFGRYLRRLSRMDLAILFLGMLLCHFIGAVAGFAIVISISSVISLHYYVASLDSVASAVHRVRPGYPASPLKPGAGVLRSVEVDDVSSDTSSLAYERPQPHERGAVAEVASRTLAGSEISQIDDHSPEHGMMIENYHDKLSAYSTVTVDYVLSFISLNKFRNDLIMTSAELTVDLSACPYVDLNGNMALLDLARTVSRLTLVGQPVNLYREEFARQSNVRMIE